MQEIYWKLLVVEWKNHVILSIIHFGLFSKYNCKFTNSILTYRTFILIFAKYGVVFEKE